MDRRFWRTLPACAAFLYLLFCSIDVPAIAQAPRVPVAEQLAVVTNLDQRLASLARGLDAAPDQTSLTATTARFIPEVLVEAKADPRSFDGRPVTTGARPAATAPAAAPGAAPAPSPIPPEPAVEVYRKLKELGYPTKIVVYPEDNHQAVFPSSIPEVFAWFDAHSLE